MNNLLTDRWLEALGWALVHALWQFSIIWLLAALLLRLTRAYTAKIRYGIAVASLFLCLLSFAGTFMWQLQQQPATAISMEENASKIETIPAITTHSTPTDIPVQSHSRFYNWKAQLKQAFPIVVLLWMIGVLFFCIRFAANYQLLHFLKAEALPIKEMAWKLQLSKLKNQMGIQHAVQLLESAIVKAPLTFGHFKPIILVPIGLLNALPPEQVEALLLHELAHIRRNDFLVNLLVSLLEALCFFHPVIWWLSARLRESREECCDELVIARGIPPITYAESLLSITKPSKIQFVMNAKNHASHFSTRIRRLLVPEVKASLPRPALSVVLAIAVVALTAFSSLFAQDSPTVSVAADKMNVLYIGVDNPITIAVAGVPNEQIQVSSKELALIAQGNGQYIARASEPGTAVIHVESQGKLLKAATFRVQGIPDPEPSSNVHLGGKISVETFKKWDRLDVASLGLDFPESTCPVVYYNVVWIRKREDPVDAIVRDQAEFSEKAKGLIARAEPGDVYYFTNIIVKCDYDQVTRDLGTISFQIIE